MAAGLASQLDKESSSPNRVFRLHSLAQPFFGTIVIASMVSTIKEESERPLIGEENQKDIEQTQDVCYEKLEPLWGCIAQFYDILGKKLKTLPSACGADEVYQRIKEERT